MDDQSAERFLAALRDAVTDAGFDELDVGLIERTLSREDENSVTSFDKLNDYLSGLESYFRVFGSGFQEEVMSVTRELFGPSEQAARNKQNFRAPILEFAIDINSVVSG